MALSDKEREKTIKRKPRALTDKHSRYSDKQKIDFIQTWLATGNLSLTCRIHGVTEITARVWKTTQWWKDTVEELKMAEKIQMSSKMKQLLEASQAIVSDRLLNGDPVLNQKTGEIIMKPVSMKDAHKVATDYIDRRNVLEKMTVDKSVSDDQNDDKLVKLAERFAEIATKSIEKKRNLDYVEVIDEVAHDDPVPDEVLSIEPERSEEVGEEEQITPRPTST